MCTADKYIVGLTGGIGSGKSAAARYFASHGVVVIDADQVARDVVMPGSPALTAIVQHFGDTILDHGGMLNRAALRERIFQLAAEKQWLEALLHPLINGEIDRRIAAANSCYVVVVSPLLIESGRNLRCQRVLVLDVPETTQMTRTVARDHNSETLVRNIMATQLPRQNRLQAATDIVDNSGDLPHLQRQIEQLHRKYLDFCQQSHD